MTALTSIPGFYGKIPARGDFVARRLDNDFIESWDKWLQGALSASKAQLGTRWPGGYLTSPIWHFVLSPGICGPFSWAGILLPSMDKVGRYFPLTLAAPLEPNRKLAQVFMGAVDWFERLEQLAQSALEDNIDQVELDARLQELAFPGGPTLGDGFDDPILHQHTKDRLALHMSMDSSDQMSQAFAQLGFQILVHSHPSYSLWRTAGSASIKPCLRVYDNLPPMDGFCELLISQQRPDAGDTETKERQLPADEDQRTNPAVASGFGTIEKQPIRWTSCGATTIGKYRKINEDAYLERPEIGLWAVADGMGGHGAGDVASKTVIEGLVALAATGNLETYIAHATQCLRTVNVDLIEMAGELDDRRIIGSTVVLMLAVGKRCAAIWAGDSRLYQLRDGMLTQLTCDHSVVGEAAQKGTFSGEEGDTQKLEDNVTRTMGADPKLSFDVVSFDASAGDLFLLCSDGLTKEVQHQQIADVMEMGGCQTVGRKLIDLSTACGARDNTTVVVIEAG